MLPVMDIFTAQVTATYCDTIAAPNMDSNRFSWWFIRITKTMQVLEIERKNNKIVLKTEQKWQKMHSSHIRTCKHHQKQCCNIWMDVLVVRDRHTKQQKLSRLCCLPSHISEWKILQSLLYFKDNMMSSDILEWQMYMAKILLMKISFIWSQKTFSERYKAHKPLNKA